MENVLTTVQGNLVNFLHAYARQHLEEKNSKHQRQMEAERYGAYKREGRELLLATYKGDVATVDQLIHAGVSVNYNDAVNFCFFFSFKTLLTSCGWIFFFINTHPAVVRLSLFFWEKKNCWLFIFDWCVVVAGPVVWIDSIALGFDGRTHWDGESVAAMHRNQLQRAG